MLFYLNEMAAEVKRQRKGSKDDTGRISGGRTVAQGHRVFYLEDYSSEEITALFGGNIGRQQDHRM